MNDYTAVAKNKLYCDREKERQVIQSIFFLRGIFGGFFIPFLTEVIGRKLGFTSSIAMGFLSGIILFIGIETDLTAAILIGNFGLGMMVNGTILISYFFAAEFCSDKMRQKACLIFLFFWPLGEVLFVVVQNTLPNWDEYLMYLIIIPLIAAFLICLFFLIESPYFAKHKSKDLEQYKKSLSIMALYNGVDIGHILVEVDEIILKNKGAAENSISSSSLK